LTLAASVNKEPLPAVPESYGVRLPPEPDRLTAVNFDLVPKVKPQKSQANGGDESMLDADGEDESGLFGGGQDDEDEDADGDAEMEEPAAIATQGLALPS
jgi:transcription initiation factor TFIID subunit 9B